ncbi:MAG: cyclic lactone autoinducer peptide [Ruminococcus sp.]|nr:cyclic lactone autoinducer peptide [Ruminococcus sp.]
MTKKTIKKRAAGVVSKIAEKVAWGDTSQLCLYYLYQPKCPKLLKNHRPQ